jgi:uncharacterized metal-binding protein
MKWPPYGLRLRLHNPRRSLGLWLPLFLLGPIALVFLLAFFLIVLVFAILATVFTWQFKWWRPLVVGVPALVRTLWSLRGLSVDVENGRGGVEIKFQ